MAKIIWIRNKKPISTVFNKTKKENITTHNKIKKQETTLWNKPVKEKIVKKKIDKIPTTTRDKTEKPKFSNKNKDLQKLQDIINRIEGWTPERCEELVEKYTPRTDKRDYKEVAFSSRGLDQDFDLYRFCEVTYKIKWIKVNADEIHHIRWKEWSLYNDPYNLIFVCRKEHDRIHQYDVKWLQEIVKKYII